jgi:hypothetical protein
MRSVLGAGPLPARQMKAINTFVVGRLRVSPKFSGFIRFAPDENQKTSVIYRCLSVFPAMT